MITNKELCASKGYDIGDMSPTVVKDQCDLWRNKEIREAYIRALELAGTFDWAIPKAFADHVTATTGENPSGHIVWAYPDDRALGSFPAPISPKGARMIARCIS